MWSSMPVRWQVCFEEAWKAYCSGSIPIGAALTDPDGAIVSRGRNRVHEREAPPGQICMSRLAHAEINVLLQIRTADSNVLKDLTLYTTTEPCVQCFGAIAMSGVRTVRYAASDPIAGGADLNRSDNPFIRGRNIDIRKADHRLGEIQRVIRTDYVLGMMDPDRAERILSRECGEYPRAVELAEDGARRAGCGTRRGERSRSWRLWTGSRRNSIGCSGHLDYLQGGEGHGRASDRESDGRGCRAARADEQRADRRRAA